MAKSKGKKDKPAKVHEELEGFDIKINPLGEVVSNIDIEKINEFLDKNVEDKKLKDRDNQEEE